MVERSFSQLQSKLSHQFTMCSMSLVDGTDYSHHLTRKRRGM